MHCGSFSSSTLGLHSIHRWVTAAATAHLARPQSCITSSRRGGETLLPQHLLLLRPLALGDAGEGRPPPSPTFGREAGGGRGRSVYFRCIRSGTFKGRCDFGVNKYRRASNPSKVSEAFTSSVLPTTRQTSTKASQRRVERGREIANDWLRRGKSQWWSNPNRKWDSFRLCPAKSLGQRRARQGQERWTSVKKLARRCRR